MTIELVDGHANKPHISGDDLGDFKAGILGNDGYVFNRANKLAATLNGSNSVTIATGSGILPNSGRHFRVTAPETLTITSGTQGQNRNDLCVVRASTSDDGTTVENAQLLILRGTPTSGTASDPETQEGDLVLYRFQLTGVSVAEPIALFSVMVPYNDFRDSISHIQVRTRENVSFNVTSSASQSVTSIRGFTDIDPDSIVAFIPVISACSVSSVNAAALWNTDNGHNDLQLVTSQAQTIKVNLTVVYTVD